MGSRALRPLLLLLALALTACGDEQPAPQTQVPASGQGGAPAAESRAPTAPTEADKKPAAAAAPASARGGDLAPTPATVMRDTELKDKPFTDAATLKRLPAQTAVTIVAREGGWLRVTGGGQQGWVRLLHVSSRPPGGGADTAQELESVAKMATGRSGSGNVVNTTGIRGLSAEQLRAAKPDPEEVRRLEAYGVSREQAAAYARRHELERRQIAQLPEPR